MPHLVRRYDRNVPHSIPRFSIWAVFALLLFGGWLLFPVQGLAVELGDLLDAPAKYDGMPVKVTGAASEPRYRVSRGKPFTVFDLSDKRGRTVRVFSWGQLTIHRGDRLEVEGRFIKSKAVGRHAIENEIEAAAVRPAPEHF
ncbi:MAG: hypothetical protein HY204_02685 [Nitrospirae bacterium]|nr:hypothetical protein [Nitrospirota bacterium]